MTKGNLSEEIIQADLARIQAMVARDHAALDAVLADDLVYMHSTGAIDSKASFIEALLAQRFLFRSVEHLDTKVRVYGDAAILNGKVCMVVEAGGAVHQVTSSFSTVWVRAGGQWQLVHWQSTPMPRTAAH